MYVNLAKIYPGDLLQNLETPGLSGRVDRYESCTALEFNTETLNCHELVFAIKVIFLY